MLREFGNIGNNVVEDFGWWRYQIIVLKSSEILI